MTAHAPTPSQVRDAWDDVAEGFDRYTTPHTMAFGDQVLSRLDLGPGVRVLDVGAGTGGLSIPAARTGADVVAVDISPKMIAHLSSRARVEGLTTLQARVGDGAALDFQDESFDVAISMNGVSLFPDIIAGVAEMARVTRAGGRLAVVTFGRLERAEFIAFFLGAVAAVVPGALPPSTGSPMPPFRLADPATLRAALQDAGLRDVRVDTATWETRFASVDHFLETVLSSNPIARQLTAALTNEQLRQVRLVLDGMLRERSGGDRGAVLHCEMQIGEGSV